MESSADRATFLIAFRTGSSGLIATKAVAAHVCVGRGRAMRVRRGRIDAGAA
jgi:hypothetical protein